MSGVGGSGSFIPADAGVNDVSMTGDETVLVVEASRKKMKEDPDT